MKSLIQQIVRQPLWIICAIWPLALLVPFVPGLPRPVPSGLLWRQEMLLAFLLCLTLAACAGRAWQVGARVLRICRRELFLWLPLALFVSWSTASLLWAASSVPVLHYAFVWGAYLLFFLLLRSAAEQPRLLHASIKTVAVAVWILSVSCVVEFWGAPNDSAVRTASLFRFNNAFGEALAVITPLFAALALGLRRARAATLCGATAVMAWLAMLQALERAPMIGATAGLLVLAIVPIKFQHLRPHSLRRALILFVAFVAVTVLQAVPSPLTQGRSSAFARLQATSAAEPNTRVRFLFWGTGLEMLRAHPVTGVGANNYEIAFPEARAQFSVRHHNSALVGMHEEMLVERAHNEYVQMLAEVGMVGFALFLIFCVMLLLAIIRALRHARSPLALGASASMLTFLISSGASSVSFRWMGSGLLFFFAAALVCRFASGVTRRNEVVHVLAPARVRMVTAGAFVFTFIMLCGMGAQAITSTLHGAAQVSDDKDRAEQFYRASLSWNPYDAGTNFDYGVWLFYEGRAVEAVPHLRYATSRGFNASACYAYLAAAESAASETVAAEKTLAHAVGIYPRSVFLRVRHARALTSLGREKEAQVEYQAALLIDSRLARGWWQLINHGADAAVLAAQKDSSIAMPGELLPENCVFVVLAENESRPGAFAGLRASLKDHEQ